MTNKIVNGPADKSFVPVVWPARRGLRRGYVPPMRRLVLGVALLASGCDAVKALAGSKADASASAPVVVDPKAAKAAKVAALQTAIGFVEQASKRKAKMENAIVVKSAVDDPNKLMDEAPPSRASTPSTTPSRSRRSSPSRPRAAGAMARGSTRPSRANSAHEPGLVHLRGLGDLLQRLELDGPVILIERLKHQADV